MKRITKDDLANNPIPRLASCLVLDTSHSMGKSMGGISRPIDELNKGVTLYFDAINNNEKTKEMVEISIITFGNKEFSPIVPEHEREPKKGVKKIIDFDEANVGNAPVLVADGFTPMGEAVEMALDLLEKRKEVYKETAGVYKQPWLVIMTDGYPYDYQSKMREKGSYDGESVNEPAKKVADLVNDKKLVVIPIALGDDANMDILGKFSPKNKPVKIQDIQFEKFFEFLSQSQANPDQDFISGATDYLEEMLNKSK